MDGVGCCQYNGSLAAGVDDAGYCIGGGLDRSIGSAIVAAFGWLCYVVILRFYLEPPMMV